MSFVRSVVVVFVFVGAVVYVMMSRSYEGSYPGSRSNLWSIPNVISGRSRCGQMSMRRKHGTHEAGGEQAKWSKGRWTNND